MNITVPAGASSDPSPQGTHAQGVVIIDPATGDAFSSTNPLVTTSSGGGGAVDRAFVYLSYQVITAFTGAAVGNLIQQIEEFNTATTPSTYVDTIWRNVTLETTLSSAPSAANITPVSATATSVSISSTVPPTNPSTFVTGQVVIATSGVAVRLTATSTPLQNGVAIKSISSNNVAGQTVGSSSVTNTVNGTGNGYVMFPGEAAAFPSPNLNEFYVNGTAGDIFTFYGN